MKKLIASLLTVATVASMASMSVFADAKDISLDAKIGKKADGGFVLTDTNEYMEKNEVKPDKTIYIDMNKVEFLKANDAKLIPLLNDDDYFKVKTDKGDDDSKMIKKISVTEKDISDTTAGREIVVKIELKDDMTDTEYKINPSVTFTAKKDINLVETKDADGKDPFEVSKDDKFTINLGKVYVSNTEMPGDHDWKAGDNGYVAKPTKNDDNEVTWEDENNTIAKLTFEGDDDAAKYYPKLSTKWDDADYAENFAGADAFIRNFVGHPTIAATSRPVLELYNPFVDDDDEATVAIEDIVIYEVVDGALVDVTEKFTAGENDDGDSVFTIKTRTLGTYIFSNGAAVAPEEVPAEVETPAEVEKANPGTGRF